MASKNAADIAGVGSVFGVLKRVFAAAFLLALAAPGCKDADSPVLRAAGLAVASEAFGQSAGEVYNAHRSAAPSFAATDLLTLQSTADFYFRVWNDNFSRKLSELPATGTVADDKIPWSGSYYPYTYGDANHQTDHGTDIVMVGSQSPLQKYDAVFNGGQNKAAAWEQAHHTGGVAWSGHCNGFSAAAQRHPKEPVQSVTRNGVIFAPQDIKALLAETYMAADYVFLGGNRCGSAAVAALAKRADPTVMGDCEDVNPGTFHAALTNWIGKMHHTIIMDIKPNEQIWNYPVYKYQILAQTPVTAAQAAQYVAGGGSYKYNPSAASFVYVQTQMSYADDFQYEILGKTSEVAVTYSYVLELDADGQIVGGEWSTASHDNHPDFIWVALEPAVPNGSSDLANPNLDSGNVIKLWAESVGLDPNSPPLDIKRPPDTNSWGKWSDFNVVLDGTQSGAVFLGKQTIMHVTRSSVLTGGSIAVAVSLNGTPLQTVTTTANEEVRLAFAAGVGRSELEFTFSKGGTTLEHQYLQFHAVR